MTSSADIKIHQIFQSILGDSYANEVTPVNIESVAYVELLIAFQNEFKIKFTTQEFFTLRDVKNIKESLHKKIQK